MKRTALALLLVLTLSTPALAHTKPASHDGCGATHSLTYDGYSGGQYWYHSMSYKSVGIREQAMKHYYRAGPPSAPVYYYVNTTYWLCV